MTAIALRPAAAFDEAKHPRGPGGKWTSLGWDDIDRVIEHEFHPVRLEARQVKHPKSGYMVDAGISRAVTRPERPDRPLGNDELGPEGPATFTLKDHGDPHKPSYNSLAYMLGKPAGTEPIPHVYRGMSETEWQQAQARGFIESDKRGVISGLEGTNAAVDPRSAVSYLPTGNQRGYVAKITVRPEDKWFTIGADEYLRTRQPIPLDRVEHVVEFRKTGKYDELQTRAPVPPATPGAAMEVGAAGEHRFKHGWIPLDGGGNDHKPAAQMTKDELIRHLTGEHGGGPVPPGRQVGRRNRTKQDLVAHHEQMHKLLSQGSPYVEQGIAHTHGRGVQVGAAKGGGGGPDPAEKLRIYWAHGEGAAKVRWGTPGDFDRCVMHVGKFMDNPQGYCAERHHDALGIWPATHAKLDREGKGNVSPKGAAALVIPDTGAAAWDPSAHPRAPAGGSTGGQFAPGAGGATPTNAAPVQQGQSGPQVRQLQERLNALGAKPKLAVDGKFGPLTLAAVRAYQRTHKDSAGRPLKVDGLVGPKTTSALRLKTQAKPGTSTHTTGNRAKPAAHKTPARKAPARKLSDKPGSSTPAQHARINTLVKQRKVDPADAADMTNAKEQKALAQSEAQALIAHLLTLPKRPATGAHAAARPGDAAGLDVMAFQWAHGWKRLGGGPGRRKREPLIPEGGEGIPLEPGTAGKRYARDARRMGYKPGSAKPVPPLRNPLIPEGLVPLEPPAGETSITRYHAQKGQQLTAHLNDGTTVSGRLESWTTVAIRIRTDDNRTVEHPVSMLHKVVAPVPGKRARAGAVAARGSGRYKHGWIKIDSAAADDLDRGLTPGAAHAVASHLDKAWKAHQDGEHAKAEDHLMAAEDRARYGGTAPRLKETIRDALTEVRTSAKRTRPGAGPRVSRRETEGFAQMFGHAGGKARPRRGKTIIPGFGHHVSKREARGFAQMFAAGPDGGAVPAGLPALVTIPGVELLAAGTWHLSSGRQTFTRADLAAAAEAAACPAVGPPVIKIGHLDPRFAPQPGQDGEPAIGRVANIRLNDAGTKLTGDLAGMPGWLGAIAASAFPRRSVEGKFRFKCQIGHEHPFALTALALLGVTPPGVGVLSKLADIAALYGVSTTPSTTAAAAQAGTWRTEPTEPTGAVMAVTEEDVRRAYYAHAGAPQSWWITELQMQPPQLIVADEESGKLYRVPYAIEGAAVSFGSAGEIASYSDVAAARGTGPVVVYASAEESRDTGEGDSQDDEDGADGEPGDDEEGGDPGGGDVSAASDRPWSDFTQADYTPAQWHAACLIHDHGGGVPDTKDQCKLPVKEPGGTLNRNGVHAAAGAIGGARGGVSASSEQKAKAKSALRGLYGTLGEDPPDSIKAAADDSEAVEAGPGGPKHGNYKGRHSHPHFATGDQGDDETHEHVHSHDGDDSHDHAHDTQAAAQAATPETGGDLDMGFEFTHDQMAAIRQRLGKADSEPVTADDIAATMATPRAPVVAAAAGGSDTADVQVPQISDGTYLVDGDILRGYQERAVAGDRAVHALHLAERDTILASAVADGKFAQARKDHFERLWDKDPEGTRKLVDKLAPGLIPMASVGSAGEFAGDPDLPGDFEAQRAYLDLYPEDRPGGAPSGGVRTGRRG